MKNTTLTLRELTRLRELRNPSSVTLTCPLTPEAPEQRTTRLKMRHLLEQARDELSELGTDRRTIDAVLGDLEERFSSVSSIPRDGRTLVAFRSPEERVDFVLDIPMEGRVVVADRFSVGHLMTLVDHTVGGYALVVSDDGASMLHVKANRFDVVDLPLSRRDRASANAERVQPRVGGNAHANRYSQGSRSTGSSPTTHMQGFGHKDEDEIERRAWHEIIAKAVQDVLAENSAPVVVIADVVHHAGLKAALDLPQGIEETLAHNPKGHTEAELAELARPALETTFAAEPLRERMATAAPDSTVTDLKDALAAARNGRVDLLLWRAGAEFHGVIDDDGVVEFHAKRKPGDLELIDELIALTLLKGGEAYPLESLPVGQGAPLNGALRW